MYADFSESALKVMAVASAESRRFNHFYVGVEHVFMGLLTPGDPATAAALRSAGVDGGVWYSRVSRALSPGGEPAWGRHFIITPRTERVLKIARKTARALDSAQVQPAHLLIGIVIEGKGLPVGLLRDAGVDPGRIRDAALGGANSGRAAEHSRHDTPEIDRYTHDLTADATSGRLDPVIGRDTEILRLAQILTRRTKGNAIILGEAGVGKSSLVHGLAQRIIAPSAPAALQGLRIVELNLGALIGGTRYRGDLEERLDALLRELRRHPRTVLFVDEIHTLVGAGAAIGGLDVGSALKPALADGSVRCIGATTLADFRRSIERDPALGRRFEPIVVEEADREATLAILRALRPSFERHHGVRVDDGALTRALLLAERYLSERRFPDKAIDVVEDACAQSALATLSGESGLAGSAVVDAAAVERVVSQRINVSASHLSSSDAELVTELAERLAGLVVGQDEAVRSVADAVRVRWTGLGDRRRPIGVFLFVGPTGVGKTELARTLAISLFGTERKLLRFDMSEYAEAHSVSKLLGAPPGYVGFEEGGQLATAVRANPYAVLLLDEIEKAHPDLSRVFLQVFDAGRLTDSHGRTLDFRNLIIIMSSNLGAGASGRTIGFGGDSAEAGIVALSAVENAVAHHFAPEFQNRIDHVVFFRTLTEPAVLEVIARRSLERHLKEFEEERGIPVDVSPELIRAVVELGFSREFGARNLERATVDNVISPFSRWLLEHSFAPGGRLRLEWHEGLTVVRVSDEAVGPLAGEGADGN